MVGATVPVPVPVPVPVEGGGAEEPGVMPVPGVVVPPVKGVAVEGTSTECSQWCTENG